MLDGQHRNVIDKWVDKVTNRSCNRNFWPHYFITDFKIRWTYLKDWWLSWKVPKVQWIWGDLWCKTFLIVHWCWCSEYVDKTLPLFLRWDSKFLKKIRQNERIKMNVVIWRVILINTRMKVVKCENKSDKSSNAANQTDHGECQVDF